MKAVRKRRAVKGGCCLGILILSLCCLMACKNTAKGVDMTMEDGVEVLHNPMTIPGRPVTFSLEEEFVIDTEKEAVAGIGLTDIAVRRGNAFQVDSRGNVYVYCPQNKEHVFFKFDRGGHYVTAFGKQGQGPGEVSSAVDFILYKNSKNEEIMAVTDLRSRKYFRMDCDGSLIEEKKFTGYIQHCLPLGDNRALLWKIIFDPSATFITWNDLVVAGPDFKTIRLLDSQKIPNPIKRDSFKGIFYVFSWAVSDRNIFTGFQDGDYEIRVFDFEGKLIRKIRKEYARIPVPDSHKKEFMKMFEAPVFDPIRKKTVFPETMPPFHGFFADDRGRLFVMTYEAGEREGEYMYDIFDPDGVFVGRKSLKIHHDEMKVYAVMKEGRLYRLEEKESGYKRLVVSKVNWQ